MAQLRGSGGDAEPGIHHRVFLAECHHAASRHPDGQVWAAPNPPGGKVNSFRIVTEFHREVCKREERDFWVF